MRNSTTRIPKHYGVRAASVAIVGWPAVMNTSVAQNVKAAPGDASSAYGVTLPPGYRDWSVISIARVGGIVNDLRVKLGNDVAIKTYRDGKTWFPDGAVIARLAYRAVASEENNAVIRAAAEHQGLPPDQVTRLLAESVIAGPALNVQIMVKDSKKYAATGGWGFAQFTNGKADTGPVLKTCFSCHEPAKARDFVFTSYSP